MSINANLTIGLLDIITHVGAAKLIAISQLVHTTLCLHAARNFLEGKFDWITGSAADYSKVQGVHVKFVWEIIVTTSQFSVETVLRADA